MGLENLFTMFVPKNKQFYELFEKSSANLVDISKVFNEFINSRESDKRLDLLKKINDLEHVGDSITHDIFTALSINFITPFDREDIHYLATSLDDIVDFIDGSAKRISLYRLDQNTTAMVQLAEVIEKSAVEINEAVKELKDLKNLVRIREALVKINSLENHADDIFDGAIGDLFNNEKDPIMVIKMKDILSTMETATDKCEDVANVIETILIKNS